LLEVHNPEESVIKKGGILHQRLTPGFEKAEELKKALFSAFLLFRN